MRVLFEPSAVIGRVDVEIPVVHPELSRRHLEIARRDGRDVVRDLSARNGTFLNGARLPSIDVAIEHPLHLRLGTSIECEIARVEPDVIAVDVGAVRTLVAFGDRVRLGAWTLTREAWEGGFVYVLDAAGAPMRLGEVEVESVELARGDAVSESVELRLRVDLEQGAA